MNIMDGNKPNYNDPSTPTDTFMGVDFCMLINESFNCVKVAKFLLLNRKWLVVIIFMVDIRSRVGPVR